jgi:hypothetical protein
VRPVRADGCGCILGADSLKSRAGEGTVRWAGDCESGTVSDRSTSEHSARREERSGAALHDDEWEEEGKRDKTIGTGAVIRRRGRRKNGYGTRMC